MGKTYSCWAIWAAIVHELDDGIRVVVKVCRECSIGKSVSVGSDGVLETLGHSLSIRIAQTL